MSVFLAEGISAKAVEEYIRECNDKGIFIRTLQIIKGDAPLVRFCAYPHAFDRPQHLYSLSKSFTSIACGICMDEGLLSPDTKMCELFADKMPEQMTDGLKSLKLSDLLTMQSGHSACVLGEMRWAEDSIKAFFEQPMCHTPGTTFAYSTAATCVCAAAAERVSGKKLVDLLDEKLFSKLSITKPKWTECRDGQTLGGTGLYLSNNDLVKFGMLLKNKGVYNGERIISEKYLADATRIHSVDANNGSVDWTSGYGYQFWMNHRGGFRGDGAFGQLCIVLPEEDYVITLLGEVGNMAEEMSMIYKLLDSMYGDDNGLDGLKYLADNMFRTEKSKDGFNDDIAFTVGENRAGISRLRLFGENLLHVELETDYGKKEIVCGNGEYISNHVMLQNLMPSIIHLDPDVDTVERLSVFASYETCENGIVRITLRHSDKPHTQIWTISPDDETMSVSLHVGDIVCREFKLTKISIL